MKSLAYAKLDALWAKIDAEFDALADEGAIADLMDEAESLTRSIRPGRSDVAE